MAHRIGPTPQLSQPQGNSPEDVRNLGRAFFVDSTDLRARLQHVLPVDGSEKMVGPLPLAQFTTVNLPSAALWKGALAYDLTLNAIVRSDGVTWNPLLTDTSFGVWGTWTPTYAGSTSGTPTVTTNAARFKQVGKSVLVRLDASITAIGTAVGNFLTFTLPVTPLSGSFQTLPGREIITAGLVIVGQFNSSTVTIVGEGAGGSSTLVLNYRHILTGLYEAA